MFVRPRPGTPNLFLVARPWPKTLMVVGLWLGTHALFLVCISRSRTPNLYLVAGTHPETFMVIGPHPGTPALYLVAGTHLETFMVIGPHPETLALFLVAGPHPGTPALFLVADLTPRLYDDDIRTGEEIGTSIRIGIKHSKSAIIVFSENYASSPWCLDELVLILERLRTPLYLVVPIFYYGVDPAHMRYQTESYARGLVNLERRHKHKMEGGRAALTQAANLNDWPVQG
ncbi:hypothetical protein RJ640_011632 [Escallonia rubra]|uniref:ADP-ribosyl cyclase/cyclic ADP-ribose hydrolase n=1 Tax=Escallonia rubra TaxID=112253 RepID=A0AA88UFT3_9ASTE|nr:hypothetical protein RJ640_011632 [Escallonia rubra]